MKQLVGLGELIRMLEGTAIVQDETPLTVKTAFVTCLSRGKSEDPVRTMKVALDLFREKGDTLNLEDADFGALHRAVKADLGYSDLVKAVLLPLLDNAKTPPKEEPSA